MGEGRAREADASLFATNHSAAVSTRFDLQHSNTKIGALSSTLLYALLTLLSSRRVSRDGKSKRALTTTRPLSLSPTCSTLVCAVPEQSMALQAVQTTLDPLLRLRQLADGASHEGVNGLFLKELPLELFLEVASYLVSVPVAHS